MSILVFTTALQVMGPAAEMATPDASTSAIKLIQLPRLARDGENWLTYQEKVVNAIKARKLRRHLTETARKADRLVRLWGIPSGSC
jgi:hypothetical protein